MSSNDKMSPGVWCLVAASLSSILFCSEGASRCWYSDRQWPTARGPAGIAADSSGYVYVACQSDNRIQKFTSTGKLIAEWGRNGDGPGQFDGPQGIAVDPLGHVYVADTNNRRIQKFRSDGSFIGQLKTYTKDPVRTFRPFGVATDPKGQYIYISDIENQRILKFGSDGSPVRAWSNFGTSERRFIALAHVATDALGFVYVADSGANDVKKFTSLGSFRADRSNHDGTSLVIPSPVGVAVDRLGYVFLTDASHSIQQLDPTLRRTGWFGACAGSTPELVGHWHEITSSHVPEPGSGPGQFRRPHGIAADPSGNLYIADHENHRVQKLVTLRTSGAPDASVSSKGR